MTEQESEVDQKLRKIEKLLAKLNLQGVCLSKAYNFSWITGGGINRVVTGSETGAAAIVILGEKKYVIAPKNEIKRFMEEQVQGLGFEPWTYEWYESRVNAIKKLVKERKIGTDTPMGEWPVLGAELNRLRYSLTAEEVKRAEELSEICSREIAATCLSIVPGQSEFDIQAELSKRLMSQGVRPAVLLVAADERKRFRHPVTTAKRLKNYVIIGLVGEKGGLHSALTRSVYFGSLPDTLRNNYKAALAVEKTFLENCKIGVDCNTVFEKGNEAYANAGFPDEWKRHHQGGAIGYIPREYRIGETQHEVFQPNQMLAWNPTVDGTKVEETVLLMPDNQLKVLTSVPEWWPQEKITLPNQEIQLPLVLER
ncbi:M24 family metallopeptidase [Desulfitobacterium sp.]|uniref:M24 family metallopeptidase n=1 Tax=Desulfitobacterium sp. TaxID=49981 RepID=UPI002B1EC189|nr:M24 family metallopeptidase [Desulfitobacterium sp.]MEA4900684.1 M24 family metallopeptidase [Desulfitobacterium sp.]